MSEPRAIEACSNCGGSGSLLDMSCCPICGGGGKVMSAPCETARQIAEQLREAAAQTVFENQVEVYPGALSKLLQRAADALTPAPTTERDDLGLSIDMRISDRLRSWAENVERDGPDITRWASTIFLTQRLRKMADDVEQAVRDIGTLRDQRASLTADLAQARQERDKALVVLQSPDKWMKWCDSRVLERAEAVEALSLKLVDGMNAQAVAALASEAERNVELECQLAVEKTARAAAEQALAKARQDIADWKEVTTASETQLAQARQEHNQAVERQMLALDAKFAAEQARDEALAARHVSGCCGAPILFVADAIRCTGCDPKASKAACTALLEAAEEAKRVPGSYTNVEMAAWLTTRAGGPRT